MAPKLPRDNAQTAGQFIAATNGDADATQYGQSYHLAFADHAFLSRPEVRGISRADAEQLVARAHDDYAALSASTALENSEHYESARD